MVIGVTPEPGVGSAGSGLLVGANPETASPGDSIILSWATGDGSAVTVSPDTGPTPCAAGSFCYGPHASTKMKLPSTLGPYTFTVRSGRGASTSIMINNPKTGGPTVSMTDGNQAHVSRSAGLTVQSFLLKDQCVEDFSPDWLESHGTYNRDEPGSKEFLANGFVHIA